MAKRPADRDWRTKTTEIHSQPEAPVEDAAEKLGQIAQSVRVHVLALVAAAGTESKNKYPEACRARGADGYETVAEAATGRLYSKKPQHVELTVRVAAYG